MATKRNSKYHQGYFTPVNPEKYKGNSKNIVYRSSYEFKYMMWCDNNPDVIKWSSEEYFVNYISPIDGNWHRYFVDFYIEYYDINRNIKKALIEVKPFKQTQEPKRREKITKSYINEVKTYGVNQAKWKYAQAFCAKKGWDFKIFTEEQLGIADKYK